MNALRLLVAGVGVVALTAGVRAEKKEDKKDNAKLLMGAWEVTKSFDKGPPVGSVVEFGKDGKVKGTAKVEGKEVEHEGTYKVDGDKIAVVMKHGDKEMKHAMTIKKISDTEMVAETDTDKVIEFKRKK